MTTHCSNCGDVVSSKGPASKSGKRFCSRKGCQAAKVRLRRQTLAGDRQAPAECSGCRKVLRPRAWRAGDENGRWCTKERCRSKRRAIQDDIEAGVDALRKVDLLENAISLLSEAVMADMEEYIHANRVVCHECGLTSALRGWPHRREDATPCWGTLGDRKKLAVQAHHLDAAWPARREYLSAADLEAAYGD